MSTSAYSLSADNLLRLATPITSSESHRLDSARRYRRVQQWVNKVEDDDQACQPLPQLDLLSPHSDSERRLRSRISSSTVSSTAMLETRSQTPTAVDSHICSCLMASCTRTSGSRHPVPGSPSGSHQANYSKQRTVASNALSTPNISIDSVGGFPYFEPRQDAFAYADSPDLQTEIERSMHHFYSPEGAFASLYVPLSGDEEEHQQQQQTRPRLRSSRSSTSSSSTKAGLGRLRFRIRGWKI